MKVAETLWEYMMLDALLKPVLDSQIGLANDTQEIEQRNAALKALFAEKALFIHCKYLHDKINQLHELMRIHEMDAYQLFTVLPLFKEIRACMDDVCSDIAASSAASQASDLAELKAVCASILREDFKQDFDQRWSQTLSGLEDLHSLHYRFYLDAELQVTHYALLSMNQKPFRSRNGLLQRWNRPGKDMEILAHCANAKENMHQAAEGFVPKADGIPSFSTVRSARSLFRGEVINKRLPDLYRVLPSAIPMLYAKQTQVIWGMMRELGRRIIQRMAEQRGRMQFWISAITLMEKLQAARLPWTFARIHPAQERIFIARSAYHPAVALALEAPEKLVYNDIDLSSRGTIWLLTGANGGGKTTYLRTVGAMQLFFQLGLPVPAQQAELSPVDSIVTAFSVKEDTGLSSGKLGQELLTVQEALQGLRGESLVLFNEPITGTSISECCLISQEVLAILKALQVRCVWVTHLFMLLDRICDINERLPGAKIDYLHISETDAYHVEFGRGPDDSQARAGYNRTVLDERITE